MNHRPLSALLAILCLAALSVHAQDSVRLLDTPAEALFSAQGGSWSLLTNAGEPVLRWQPEAGQAAVLEVPASSPLLERMKSMDWLNLEFNIVTGRVNDLTLATRGLISSHRRYKVHSTTVAHNTTRAGAWHTADLELSRPNWFPWDNPDGSDADVFFRFSTLALEPGTIIEFRRMTAHTGWLQLKPDFEYPVTWPFAAPRPDGSVEYRISWQLLNASGKADILSAEILSTHSLFRPAFVTNDIDTRVGGAPVPFDLVAILPAEAARAAAPLAAETLRVKFSLKGRPEVAVYWSGDLVAPLPAGTRRQVVFTDPVLQDARTAARQPTGELARILELKKVIAAADEFKSKKLLQIPTGHQWPGSPFLPPWTITDTMCQISNKVTGEVEFNTFRAGLGWKKYLEYPGNAAENLGQAYLFTGDESYATQAIAYFSLLSVQYPLLPLNKAFELPWAGGPATLGASRWSNGSTYGGSMFMRLQSRLLNMVSESPSWTEAVRAAVYTNFAVPYCLEIIKFNGGMNNQTDIGNHNVLLMGLAFQDAGLVKWALQHDGGILPRLTDIDADGFSSEGRPIGYHLAGMAEYMPSLAYLKNSGLAVPVPWARLLSAVRMPFQRAALNGRIPNTGDCARWQNAALNPHVDHILDVFPGERWLDLVAAGTTPAARIRRFNQGGAAPDKDRWMALLSPAPILFPHAGMAILRTGDTPESQIMATLDYGLNVYHGHLDRLQVTLLAFGKTFTHGFGSVYNVGRGGMTNGAEVLKNVNWASSLFQNVILVDQESQRPAIGRLLAWSAQPDLQAAVARVEGIAPGVAHTRGIVLTEGLLVVLDRMESDQPHQYDWVYHNFGDLALGAGWTSEPAAAPLGESKDVGYPFIQELRKLAGAGPLRLTWDLTRQVDALAPPTNALPPFQLDFRQVCSEPGDTYTGVVGLNNPNTRTVWDRAPSVFRRVRGTSVFWGTVLAPAGADSPLAGVEADGADGVKVTLTNGKTFTCTLSGLVKDYPAKGP